MIEVPQNKTKKVDRNKEGDWRKFILHRAVLKVFSSKLRQQEDNRLRKKNRTNDGPFSREKA